MRQLSEEKAKDILKNKNSLYIHLSGSEGEM